MSEIKRFNEALSTNAAMMEEVKKLGSDVSKIVAFANEKGYNFTAADLSQGELSDEQLDKVAGGVIVAKALLVG